MLPPLTRDQSAWRKEPSAGSRLPYRAHLDEHTLLLRDGRLMQTIHLAGLPFETIDTDELNYRKQLRDTTLRALASSRFALYHHVVRRRVFTELNGAFPDSFSQALDETWRGRLNAKALYRNDLFLTLLRRPLTGAGGFLSVFAEAFSSRANDIATRVAAEKQALDAARASIMAAYSVYGPRLLGQYERLGVSYSEPLEFLSTLFNGQVRPMRVPDGDLGDHIPKRRLFVGQQTLEQAPLGSAPRLYTAIVSIKDYPGASSPGMLDELLRLPLDLVISQSFAFVDRQAALGRVNLSLRRMRAADDEALTLQHELTEARDELAGARAAYGEHHLTVAVRSESEDGVNQGVAEVVSVLADLGIVAVREDLGLEPAFWAQFPGNFAFITRRALISSRNFASLASNHNFSLGEANSIWGEAVTVLETTAAGPYFFNFHQGDLGNFTVIGPSGSGKTVVLNFLLAQARRYDPRIIFFDKDRGAEIFIRAIGGRYDVLRPGEAAGLNPLTMSHTPANRQFLIEWIAALVSAKGVPASPEERALIEDAVAANFVAPRSLRRLRAFATLFRGAERPQPTDLYARLKPWFGDGEHAWLFDNAEDLTDASERVVGFDMTRLLDDPMTRTPTMMYLFHRVEERLDGTPAIVVVDEGWKALDDEVFVQRLKDWQKTIRKRNGLVGFVTQSAEDALDSRIASAVVEQSATQIFMANPKAQAAAYMGGFGLTQYEFDLVRSLPDNEYCFLIKHGLESVVARLDLRGEANILHVLSGRERTVRLLDELRGEVGDAPEAWMSEFLKRAA